jgi:predicted GIY-YIG superfamily endonuclease
MIDGELCNGFEHATWLLGSLIYILALDDTCVYVGRSNNFLVRLFKHRAAGRIQFNRVYVKSVLREMASAEEARLIREIEAPAQHRHCHQSQAHDAGRNRCASAGAAAGVAPDEWPA